LFAIAGCVVVISHDRWFLDRIATHILAFDGDSKVTFFDGEPFRVRGVVRADPRRHRHPPAQDHVSPLHAPRSLAKDPGK